MFGQKKKQGTNPPDKGLNTEGSVKSDTPPMKKKKRSSTESLLKEVENRVRELKKASKDNCGC